MTNKKRVAYTYKELEKLTKRPIDKKKTLVKIWVRFFIIVTLIYGLKALAGEAGGIKTREVAKSVATVKSIAKIKKVENKEVGALETKVEEPKKVEVKQEVKNDSVEGIITEIANKYGVNPNFMIRLAFYESGLRSNALNCNNSDGGCDRGIMQWNSKWHPEIDDNCAYDVRCAVEKAAINIKYGKEHQWYAVKKVYAEGIYSNYK